MASIWDFFSQDAGQRRRRALDEFVSGVERYIPPNLRPAAGAVAQMNPVQGMQDAMQAGGVVFDPEQTAEARKRAALDMGVEMAFALTPAALAARGYLTPVQGVMESLLGGSPAQQQITEDLGRLSADVQGVGRSVAQGDMSMLGEVFQRAREPQSVGADITRAPFDMSRGAIDGSGSVAREQVRSGEDIINRLRDTPSAKQVALGEDDPLGAGFTNITSLKPRALAEHRSTGYTSSEVVPPQQQASIAPLLGRDVMSIVGDNTGRRVITSVQDDVFENPVKSLAGFQYIDVPGQGYAGASSATNSKLNEALNSQDPYYMSLMMGEKSGDFSMHLSADLFGEMFKHAPIAKSDIPKVDEAIRKIGVPKNVKVVDDAGNVVLKADGTPKTKSVTTYPFTDFTSVANPNAIQDYIRAMPSGTQRAYFLKGMDKAGLQKMGVPRVSDARLAAADEDQIGMDWGTVGYRGFTPDLERGAHETDPTMSTTYDTGIDKVGNADTFLVGSRGIPANLLYRDLATEQRAKGTGGGLLMNSADYKVYEGSPKRAKQRIDDMAVETIDTFLEIERRQGREAALKYAGQLLSGGAITSDLIKAARKANAPTWVIAAMTAPASLGLLSQENES
jgi:hypothetical protein